MQNWLSCTAVCALIAGNASVANAQSTDEIQPQDRVSENVIVVTATKREQTLQETPVAVSVVQQEVIEDAQIIDVLDLQSVVPSLRVAQGESSYNTTFFIRGFGNGANNTGVEQSVGVFIDGVYRSRSASAISDLAEIERIEVLRGPQSTLFGKNASAGVISVTTKAPAFEPSAVLEATYGNYDQVLLKGYATGPVTDSLAVSLSGSYNVRDGYAENLVTGTDVGGRDRWSVRGQVLFEPSNSVRFRLIGDFDRLDETCCYNSTVIAGPTVPIIQGLGGDIRTDGFFEYDMLANFDPISEIENRGVSLQADFDLGFADLVSITAYRKKRGDQNLDADLTSLDLLDREFLRDDSNTFTQELRLVGEIGSVNFLVGGFYFSEDLVAEQSLSYGADFRAFATALAVDAAGVPLTPDLLAQIAAGSDLGGLNPLVALEDALAIPSGTFFDSSVLFENDLRQSNESWSIFGQLDFNVTDRLVATVGLNYTQDRKRVSATSLNTDLFSSLNFVEIGFAQGFGDLTGLPPTPNNIADFASINPAGFQSLQAASIDPASNPLLGFAALQFLPPFVDFPNNVENSRTRDNDLSYTFRLSYDVTQDLNLHAAHATGFKASSWNLTRDSRPAPADYNGLGAAGLLPNITLVALAPPPIPEDGSVIPPFSGSRFAGPEESRVIELGLKANFDWGRINLALFDQSIDNFQSVVFQGTGFVLSNAGKQSVRGAELEVGVRPFENLSLDFAATYLDAEYDEFLNGPGPNGPADLSGTRPAGIPEFASTIGARYSVPFSGGEAFIRGDWDYQSSVRTADNLPLFLPEREVSTINASLGVNFDSGLEALFWARNLFNDEYVVQAFPTTAQEGSFSGFANSPRTYGLTLRMRFD